MYNGDFIFVQQLRSSITDNATQAVQSTNPHVPTSRPWVRTDTRNCSIARDCAHVQRHRNDVTLLVLRTID